MSMTYSPRAMRGMTLIELGVVLLILVALAGLALPYVGGIIGNSSCELTEATLQNVRSAIIGSPTSPGFVGDMNRMPYNLGELITCPTGTNPTFACGTPTNPSLTSSYNPSSQSGWRGPYLTNANVANGITDQFRSSSYPQGAPIKLLIAYSPATATTTAVCNYVLLSYGPNGILDTEPNGVSSSTRLPTINSSSPLYNASGVSNCPNISTTTLNYLTGIPYLEWATSTPFNRLDDQLLFIESVDPGTNATCNNN